MKSFVITTKDSKRKPQLKELKPKIITAVNHRRAYISLYKTIVQILEDNNKEPVLIFEDDVKLTEHFNMEKLQTLINEAGQYVDTINTGVFASYKNRHVGLLQDRFMLGAFKGTQGVIYMPSALERIKETETHIDVSLSINAYNLCVYPFMSVQKSDDKSKISKFANMEEMFINHEKELQTWIQK